MKPTASAGPTSPPDASIFFFNETATTGIYTLSLHDALPIFAVGVFGEAVRQRLGEHRVDRGERPDRKSTRLNSSHMSISYAVFCLKKKITFRAVHPGEAP